MTPEIYHVLPVNDLKPHVETGTRCHCEPAVRAEGAGLLVIHNAYDGREFYETEEDDEGKPRGH